MKLKFLLNDLDVSLSKEFIAIVEQPVLQRELFDLSSLPLFFYHRLNEIDDPIMAWPQIGLDL